MTVEAEIKNIYLKDGSHVGYLLSKLVIDGKDISVDKSPLFKTQVECNNYIRGLQESKKPKPPQPKPLSEGTEKRGGYNSPPTQPKPNIPPPAQAPKK